LARDSSRHPPHHESSAVTLGAPRRVVARARELRHQVSVRRASFLTTAVEGRAGGSVAAFPAPTGRSVTGKAMDPELRGKRPLVLLAEDEAIIAIDLEDSLRAAGFAVAGPFATNAQAEAWLETGRPDVACLDHELRDGPCDALVRALAARGVPALIFTGHEAGREPLSESSTATWVMKPVAFSTLLDKLRRIMGGRVEPSGNRSKSGRSQ
jgi:CheY-like chemotaxis protein